MTSRLFVPIYCQKLSLSNNLVLKILILEKLINIPTWNPADGETDCEHHEDVSIECHTERIPGWDIFKLNKAQIFDNEHYKGNLTKIKLKIFFLTLQPVGSHSSTNARFPLARYPWRILTLNSDCEADRGRKMKRYKPDYRASVLLFVHCNGKRW